MAQFPPSIRHSLLSASLAVFVLGGCKGSKTAETEAEAPTDADVFDTFEPAESSMAPSTARPDRDTDGIFDDDDACPEVAGVASASHPDRHGCPAEGTPAARPDESSQGPSATMIGFRDATETSATVYVQVTEKASVKQQKTGNVVTIHLRGIGVPRRNNKNPLVATHFDSVVESARLVSKKGETDLVIVLRKDASVEPEFVMTESGTVLEVRVIAIAPAGGQ